MLSITFMSVGLKAYGSSINPIVHSYLQPVTNTLYLIASAVCTVFLIIAGIEYITSAGNPHKMAHAKKIIKNSILGLILIFASGTITNILVHAYGPHPSIQSNALPTINTIEPNHPSSGLTAVLLNAITGLLRNVTESIGQPFIEALSHFTKATPMLENNSSIFNAWIVIVGLTDALFTVTIILIGMQIMSASVFGFKEVSIRQLLPRIALVFLVINSSIFLIDGVISLSNLMISVVQNTSHYQSLLNELVQVTKQDSGMGIAGLLIMIVFITLSAILVIYYITRLITLSIGAILSPIIVLLWLIPIFKDFVISTFKVYVSNIFVLFVQVVIMQVAYGIFGSLLDNRTNSLMALVLGIATLLSLLKTQGVMKELSYVASAPKATKVITESFMKGISYLKSNSSNFFDAKYTVKGSGR